MSMILSLLHSELSARACQGDLAEAMSMSLDGSHRPAGSSEDAAYSHLASQAAAAAPHSIHSSHEVISTSSTADSRAMSSSQVHAYSVRLSTHGHCSIAEGWIVILIDDVATQSRM